MPPILDSPAEAEARERELDQRLNELVAETLSAAAEAAAVIHPKRASCDHNGCPRCEVRADILDVLTSVADVIGEKATALAAAATPAGSTGRVLQLLDAIRTAQGVWTTARAFHFYRDNVRSLDGIWKTQLRTTARGDLRDLAAWGHLTVSETFGRREYRLNTRKDGRS